MRILVSIANYGTKNDRFVRQVLAEMLNWTYDVDIVVHSNLPKDFGDRVRVIEGLPTPDPKSLVYAHRGLFVENIDNYDLFFYTEDDMLFTQEHVEAFLAATRELPDEMVAGFLRYEEGGPNAINMMDIHHWFHWEPESVARVGSYLLAELSNKHAAAYILTRKQLRIAVESGNYSLVPHRSRYGILESAASDTFVYCGLKKVICVSHIDDFLVHHLPNKYINTLGISKKELEAHVEALTEIASGTLTKATLFETETKLLSRQFDRNYQSDCDSKLINAVGFGSKLVLSVGCDSGEMEAALVRAGHQVIAIPLDAVIAKTARAKGIEVTEPSFEQALATLAGRQFDCIIFHEVLEYLQDPVAILTPFTDLLKRDGRVIASFINPRYGFFTKNKIVGLDLLQEPHDPGAKGSRDFENLGIHEVDPAATRSWFQRSGLKVRRTMYSVLPGLRKLNWLTLGFRAPRLAKYLVVVAEY